MIIQFASEKAGLVIVFIRVPLYLASSTISLIRVHSHSFAVQHLSSKRRRCGAASVQDARR
jgi:hypothetical protein